MFYTRPKHRLPFSYSHPHNISAHTRESVRRCLCHIPPDKATSTATPQNYSSHQIAPAPTRMPPPPEKNHLLLSISTSPPMPVFRRYTRWMYSTRRFLPRYMKSVPVFSRNSTTSSSPCSFFGRGAGRFRHQSTVSDGGGFCGGVAVFAVAAAVAAARGAGVAVVVPAFFSLLLLLPPLLTPSSLPPPFDDEGFPFADLVPFLAGSVFCFPMSLSKVADSSLSFASNTLPRPFSEMTSSSSDPPSTETTQ